MKVLLLVVGTIVLFMGMAWALQGAYVLPATFMRGPEWVAIGAGVAAAGLGIVLLGIIGRKPPRAP